MLNSPLLESEYHPSMVERTAEALTPTFKMYSGALKAFEGADGRKMLSCTASSSVEDLHGDTMTAACVSDMGPQAKRKNMVIFLNHSYNVPEDVFGYVADARIVSRATGDDGASIFDLDLDVVLNEANERAIATYAAIKDQGVKLGVSIGALITDWKLKDEKAGFWGGLIIEGVNLLEASIVGIPANPRSWVQNAVRALKSIAPQGTEVKEGQSATLAVSTDGSASVTLDAPTDLEIKAACSECGATGDCTHKSVETPKAPTEETPEGDADTSTEKAEEPTNNVDLVAALEKVEAAAGDDAVLWLREAFVAAMSRVEDLEKQLAAEVTAKELAEANFQEAATLVEMIANLPLGRKAVAAPVVTSFQEKYKGLYSDSMLALLDSKTE